MTTWKCFLCFKVGLYERSEVDSDFENLAINKRRWV